MVSKVKLLYDKKHPNCFWADSHEFPDFFNQEFAVKFWVSNSKYGIKIRLRLYAFLIKLRESYLRVPLFQFW